MLCSLALAACTSLPRTPYSAADASGSRVLDIDGLRRYGFDEDADRLSRKFLSMVVEDFERRYLQKMMAAHEGDATKAAAAAGVARRYFQLLRSRRGA